MEQFSATAEVGRIERVALREVWPHEALDFTPWLERNPDALGEVLDFNLDNVERERATGDFSVDLVAEDQSGDTVVIENQLERSDHDHLGKLVTYVAALEASSAIWMVRDPRPEHIRAITWLNESQSASFYMVKVEAIRIGVSPAAPLLTLITGPSKETREVGAEKQDRVERHDLREEFWASLLERALEHTTLHSTVSPAKETWLQAGSGRSGIHFTYYLRRKDTGVALVFESDDLERNHAWFEACLTKRVEIEAAFGEPLEWDRAETRKSCRVGVALDGGGYRSDRDEWPAIQARMVDAMVRLERVLKPWVESLPR
jgi:Domain of unknown function (DUF4268)